MSDTEMFGETPLRMILRQIADQSEASFIEVTDTEIIELKPQHLLLLVTLREATSLNSSTQRTRTLAIKTVDGGTSWHETLNASQGSVNLDESFFRSDEVSDNITHLWLVTQWQIEATFPTLYWTTDVGDTWQSSGAIHEFLASKGHFTSNFAEGLRFRNTTDGIVIARALSTDSGEDPIYFLQTTDHGKTWEEISNLPSWYFHVRDARSRLRWKDHSFRVSRSDKQISIEKLVHSFPVILKSEESAGD